MKSWMLFVVCFATMLFATTVKANGCGSTYCGAPAYYPSYSYQPQVQYETRYIDRVQYIDRVVPVAYPVPFTVAVPVVSYLQNGSTYAPTFNAQMANPAPAIQSAPDPQPVAAQAPRAQSLGVLTDAQIDMIIDRIEERIMARQAQAQAPQAPAPKQVKAPATEPAYETANPPPVANDSPADILKIKRGKANKSCADCHSGTTAKKIQIFDRKGNLTADKAKWQKVYNRVYEGTMPPSAEDDESALLSDAEVERLQDEWKLQPHK